MCAHRGHLRRGGQSGPLGRPSPRQDPQRLTRPENGLGARRGNMQRHHNAMLARMTAWGTVHVATRDRRASCGDGFLKDPRLNGCSAAAWGKPYQTAAWPGSGEGTGKIRTGHCAALPAVLRLLLSGDDFGKLVG
jgi:hypothetical protein